MRSIPIDSIALRAIPGAFVLNAGIEKLRMDEATATYIHAEAAKGIPPLERIDPKRFGKLVSYGEIAVGNR